MLIPLDCAQSMRLSLPVEMRVLCSNIVLFRPCGCVFTVGGFPVVVDAFVDAGDFVVGFGSNMMASFSIVTACVARSLSVMTWSGM